MIISIAMLSVLSISLISLIRSQKIPNWLTIPTIIIGLIVTIINWNKSDSTVTSFLTILICIGLFALWHESLLGAGIGKLLMGMVLNEGVIIFAIVSILGSLLSLVLILSKSRAEVDNYNGNILIIITYILVITISII